MDFTELTLNKIDDGDIFSEQRVLRNLFPAINYLEKRNSGKNEGLLDVEKCIQDRPAHIVLMKNLLSSNKLAKLLPDKKE